MKSIRIIATAIVVAAIVHGVSARTLAWYHFDDTPGTVRGLGYEYPNAIDVTKYPARLSSFVQSWGGTFIPLMATNFLYAPCNVYKDGVDGIPVTNECAISHTYDPYDADDHGGGIIAITEGMEDRDLHVQTGTVECFMKTTAGGHWVSLISRHDGNAGLTFNLHTRTAKNIVLTYTYDLGDGTTASETAEISSTAYMAIADGFWHHLAFTVDESTHEFALFVDYRKLASFTLKGSLHYADGSFWCFGGNANAGWKSGGAWDEIRFSDEVLPRKRMLRFGNTSASGDTLYWLSFEGNCDSSANSESNMSDGGTCAAQRAADFAAGKLAYEPLEDLSVEDGQGNVLLANNRSALKVLNTKAEFALSNLNMCCYSTITVEFFMKADLESGVVPEWGTIFSMVAPDSGLAIRMFNMQRRGDGGDLYVITDNPTETGGAVWSSGKDVFDGAWHHVALTVEPGTWNGNPTQDTKLYIDYEYQGIKSQMGTLSVLPNLYLKLGQSSSLLYFDEFRVACGVLPVTKFQRLRRVYTRGTAIVIR